MNIINVKDLLKIYCTKKKGGCKWYARRNKVLNRKLYNTNPVTMVHGQKDEVVPVMYSRKVLKIFPKAEKKLLVIKNGDHSLSSKKNLNIICKELKSIIKKVN